MKNQSPGLLERRWQTLAAAAAAAALTAALIVTTCPAPPADAQLHRAETVRIIDALQGIERELTRIRRAVE